MMENSVKEILPVQMAVKHSTLQDAIPQSMIEKCIRIAMDALEGKRDRDGNALILHSLMVGSMGQTDAEKCVGFLHDVIEDSDWTFDRLRAEGVPEKIITAVDLCTHNDAQTYWEYVQRVIDSGNATAIRVKQNDLHHNLARAKAFGYLNLVEKYQKALDMIASAMK